MKKVKICTNVGRIKRDIFSRKNFSLLQGDEDGHDNDDDIHKIYKVLKRHTGTHHTGRIFNENVVKNHDGKAAPYGSGYEKVEENKIDKAELILPRGKKVYLQAEEKDYQRGLIVELTTEGGYKLNYLYGEDAKIYPAEILVDGVMVKKDGREVHIKFHPELKKGEPITKDSVELPENLINSLRKLQEAS